MQKQKDEQRIGLNEYIVSETTNIAIAQSKRRVVMVLEQREWKRIKKLLEKVKPNSSRFENACWAFIGVFFTSIALLVTLPPNDERQWIWILAWTMLIVSLILSIAFGLLSNWQKKNTENSIDQIKEEMDFFEDRFILSGDNEEINPE
jgi:amino acid transporter